MKREELTQESENGESAQIERVKDFLRSYRMCAQMLSLRRYERRKRDSLEEYEWEADLLGGGEAYWRARMLEVRSLIESMRNGREKLMLYYHYIRGESIEHAADLLGFSRRTGYRVHSRALFAISFLYERRRRDRE